MREIVMDTETTGFNAETGDRLVEIGCLELFNHMPTGLTYHQYINPERDMPDGAFGVHGIGCDLLVPPRVPEKGQITLKDKPVFKLVAQDFLDFIGDAKLVIHNAKFDVPFLNTELRNIGLPQIAWDRAVDTLPMARQRFPGAPASLDALCRRFGIDNSGRELHGALLDSELLAEVYLELIGGRQPDFGLSAVATAGPGATDGGDWRPGPRPRPLPPRITAEEEEAHRAFVAKLGEAALWRRLQ